jgi:hypothetical protein
MVFNLGEDGMSEWEDRKAKKHWVPELQALKRFNIGCLEI